MALSFLPLLLVLLSSRAAGGFQVSHNWGHDRQHAAFSRSLRGSDPSFRNLQPRHSRKQKSSSVSVSSIDEDDYLRQFRPIPSMPSPLFVDLAQSQMELLAFSLDRIKAMSLYLPQENAETGQLEFLPAIIYPHSERVFIANDANSGEAPSLPKTLTRLPGFQHATSLLPGYPMVSSNSPGVGTVEEVMCDPVTRTSALSVPLFQGSQTVGVLLIWSKPTKNAVSHWPKEEKQQILRAAQSLSLALSMDTERTVLEKQSETLQTQLSDALHQVKNPIQALRTYGKLLQRKLADAESELQAAGSPQLLELAQHLMVQSDRVVDLMSPFDTIVNSLPAARLALNPYEAPKSSQHTALTPWTKSGFSATAKGTSGAAMEFSHGRRSKKPSNATIEFSRGGRTLDFGTTSHDGTIDFGTKRSTRHHHTKNGTIDFGATTRSNGTIEFGATNEDTMDFTHSEHENAVEETPPQAHNTEPSIFTSKEQGLEMGFVMDILDPIFSGGKALASERSVDLVIQSSDELPGVWTSPKALQEAVANVLDNALKYVVLGQSTYPRVMVQVEALTSSSAASRDEPGIRLRISDNGPGILMDERDAIFQRGYRGERTRTAIDGSGIGLDISQAMVAQMGGELRLVDTNAGGSIFEFILYRNKPTRP